MLLATTLRAWLPPCRKDDTFPCVQPLTRDLVTRSFDAVRERYRKSLAGLFSLASSDGSIRRLEITLHGHDAAWRFPIHAAAWTTRSSCPQ
jgi:hypothetical protein